MENNSFENVLAEIEIPSGDAPDCMPEFSGNYRLVFLRGRAKNFRSIGDKFIETDYTKSRATLVVSDENGAGKSTTTVWLIYYALTGDPYFAKEKVGSLVNSNTNKNMVVELEFIMGANQYKIVRGRKPDIFELYVLDSQGQYKQYQADAAKGDLQNHIWTILGLDPKAGPKIIENACILGRERFKPFLTMSAEERRLMVESVWDLGLFRHMTDIGKKKVSGTKAQLSELGHDIDKVNLQITSTEQMITEVKNQIENSEQHLMELERKMKIEVNQYQDRIDETNALVKSLRNGDNAELVTRRETYSKLLLDLNAELDELQNKREKLVADAEEKYKNELSSLESNVGSAKSSANELDVEITKYTQTINDTNTLLEQANTRLTPIQVELAETTEKLNKAKGYRPQILASLEAAKERKVKFETMGECPVCEQHVSPEKLESIRGEVQPIIDEAEANLNKLDNVIDKHNTSLVSIRKAIETVQSEINEYNKTLRTTQDSLDRCKRQAADYNAVAQRNLDRIEDMRSFESIVESIDHRIESERSDIKLSISNNQTVLKDLEKSSDELINTKIAGIRETEVLIESTRNNYQNNVNYTNDQITNSKARHDELTNDLQQLKVDLEDMNTKYNQLDKDLSEYQYVNELVSEKEGKADVIRMYLPFLNAKINEFLEGMNLFIGLQLDEQFNATMNNPARKGQTLFSLSTGQRARVDMAIIFAFREVANLKASFQTNLMIMDEVLENLSERGVIEAINMIKDKFKNNNLFVITQRNQEFSEHFEDQIKYGLRGDQTVIL